MRILDSMLTLDDREMHMDDYYVRMAHDPERWVRGLIVTDGGRNLLDMADDFDAQARSTGALPNQREAYGVLAHALRRQVISLREWVFEQEQERMRL